MIPVRYLSKNVPLPIWNCQEKLFNLLDFFLNQRTCGQTNQQSHICQPSGKGFLKELTVTPKTIAIKSDNGAVYLGPGQSGKAILCPVTQTTAAGISSLAALLETGHMTSMILPHNCFVFIHSRSP